MSDLKYQTVEQLQRTKKDCESKITSAKNLIGGQEVRLQWINQYIFEKTPVELSMKEIETKLGHKVILK